MANNEKISDHNGQKIEKESERPGASRVSREQRPRVKDRIDETRLPTPPSDPWLSQWYLRNTSAEMMQPRNFEEDEDMLAYFTDLETTPSDSQASECPSRNSTTSTITVPNLCMEEAFDHLNRLYSLTEQILELRHRTTKFFKRVRNLEKLKVLRNANRALEDVFASDYDAANDFCEEDTGFADSLLNAMISNCREPAFQRRSTRTPRRPRSKFDFQKQTSGDNVSKNAPKVSKWTRVKAAFKWERAYANDAMEPMDTTAVTTPTTPITPTAKYLSVPDVETGNSGSSSPSFYVDDVSDTGTPFSRTSTASLSNEAFYECSLKHVSNHSEHPITKEDQRELCTDRRSQSLDRNVVVLDAEQANDNGQEKEAIRVTEEKNGTVYPSNGIDAKGTRLTSKRPPPSLTITIPPLNDDIRCVPSPESNSSLSSSAHTPSGNSPLLRNIHREQSSTKHFKRQQSTIEESIASRLRGQDSKWSKVRRAFLTNSPLCIPPSPVKVVSRQMFLQNGQECSTPGSCNASAEDLEQLTALNAQTDTQRDYRVLREKLGAEFHQKLVEWERIKNLSPRPHAKDSREASTNLLNPRDHFLSEERLSFEFRKKLQEWKRVKKERRGSTSFEQQRFNRRRLTDWQLWKSPLKAECRNRGVTGQRPSCAESSINGGRARLSEDFLRKMDVWKRMNEATNYDREPSARSKLNRLGIGSGIDESEFLTLEKALSLFNRDTIKERRENDLQQSHKFIDGNAKSYIDAGRNMNDQVLIQTPAGAYRFDGISREFTRKLYDWEKYRGISPRSSTFRLLGPAFDPLLRETNIEIPITPITKSGSGEQVFFSDRSFRRSKSVDDLIGRSSLNESFIRRWTSLQLLNRMGNTLKNSSRTDSLLMSSNCRRAEETTEDILMDDSEPEAMIVDIEDVIEETASPLKRMQPHQTPVYSVAASETTSIAVPLGTVTSSHEPSPVLFIDIDDTLDRKSRKPNDRDHRNRSNVEQNKSDVEYLALDNVLNNTRHSSSNEDVNSDCSSTLDSVDEKYRADNSFHSIDRDSRTDFTEMNGVCSIKQIRECGIAEESTKLADEDSFEKKEVPSGPSDEGSVVETVTTEQRFGGSDECETVRRWNLGKHSTLATSIKESTVDVMQSRIILDLSSKEKHDRECDDDQKTEQDGGTCYVKDVTEVLTRLERGNEYENVKSVEDPYYCSLIDRRPLTNYETCNAERLSGSSATYKLESANWEGSHRPSRENEGESHDLSKKSNSFHIEPNVLQYGSFERSTKRLDHQKQIDLVGDTILEESTVTRREEHKLENLSTSKSPAKNAYNIIHDREPAAQTTSFTVDEEILNNVMGRSISKGRAGNAKALKQSIDIPAANDLARGLDRRSSNDDNSPVNFEKPAKKQYSPTRNMFMKTKRMIFSPFRREEDYFSRRKNSNGSDSDQACSLKTKGKSRSASPKINQQDVLSRMSFSLPWPIGSFSKEQETKEPRNETEIVYKNKRTSSLTSENDVFRKSSFQSTTVKFAEEARRSDNRASVVSFSGKREERRKEASPSEFGPSSSDLMHKLQILSSVVAKRDGRSSISEELSVESRSLRMRRAKEDFLSRRGGPLFHSVVEPSFDDQSFPRTSIDRHASGKRVARDSNNAPKETKRKTSNKEDAEEDEIDASSGSDGSLSDRAKYASTGMINVDPDIFNRLTESGRGCESLPRTSSKLQKTGGPLAKIVNKCKFIRLICGKEQNNLNTIARLCRQSLLIDIKNDFEKHWEADERANKATREE
ncbi:uncharacterized protein LOC143216883 isoform X2 [Lasioglossum baleicum]|uniref:uncharacterized protein LOC143216883 isoform X2 n=1 Tax=Lasioglossum baleicum TaxID=434251 RepID=UPI003FCC677D